MNRNQMFTNSLPKYEYFAPDAVAQAWKRIQFTSEVSRDLIAKSVQDGKDAGFLKGSTDTSKLIEIP